MTQSKSILVFGVGELQQSLIRTARERGLRVVGIDPSPEAVCRNDCDVFEVVGGQDFDLTVSIARKYGISAIITTATDKPLRMMARVAKALSLPFFSEETAILSTDKYLMKERFLEAGVPCAKGKLIKDAVEAKDLAFPAIVKPRDNSGSRGVKICNNISELENSIAEARSFSKLDSVLVEEYIDGKEYSIEALHQAGESHVLQFTEKETTQSPYNVELGHKEPANLSDVQKMEICRIIDRIATCLGFTDCASHTELKINSKGIFVIETSPRLGGDFITSHLVPLSTGTNIEDKLIDIASGKKIFPLPKTAGEASGVLFFHFPEGRISRIDPQMFSAGNWKNVCHFKMTLKEGDEIPEIKNSLSRYGEIVVKAGSRDELENLLKSYESRIMNFIIFNH